MTQLPSGRRTLAPLQPKLKPQSTHSSTLAASAAAAGRTGLHLTLLQGLRLIGNQLGGDGGVELTRKLEMLASHVEPEELGDVSEDVGALALGRVFRPGAFHPQGDAAFPKSPCERLHPSHRRHAHALELRGRGKPLEILLRRRRLGVHERDPAVRADLGVEAVLDPALGADLEQRRAGHGRTLARVVYSGTKAVKNEEPKTLPLPDELADWIERWVPRERRVAGGRLFVNPNTGGPWAETSLKRAWYKACGQVGVRVSLYTGTKHSTATELRRQGVPLDVIQKLCGHRDPRSTEVYAKLADQALVEAIRRPRMRSAGRSPGAGS